MQQISLDLDKENELIFKISIEGTKPASSRSRFLLESSDYTFVFPATGLANGQVSVLVPTLERVLEEGTYSGTLEVIVDDRVFEPVKLNAEFKKSLRVVAEAVVRKKEETTVSVEPVVVVNRQPQENSPGEIQESVRVEENYSTQKEEVEAEEVQPEPPPPPPVRSESDISVKPPQRNRVRPQTLKESRVDQKPIPKNIRKVSADDVRKKISDRHGVQLTESQLNTVLNLYRKSKEKKSKK